jgi:hypothetical protein
MATVAELVRRFGGAYLERFGAKIPAAHKKVLGAIAACRTGEPGLVLYQCACCGQIQAMGRLCRNRQCPTCQRDKADAWLETQTNRLLPCPYFLVTFTLPSELRKLARAHQRVVYSALFEASSAALHALAANPKYLGSDRLGFFGVLHTWAAPWSMTLTCTTRCPATEFSLAFVRLTPVARCRSSGWPGAS